MSVKRRDIVVGAAALAGGAAVVGALNPKRKSKTPKTAQKGIAAPAINRGLKEFRLATTWPKDFPGLGQMPNRFAKELHDMSEGVITAVSYTHLTLPTIYSV